jgi:hypothetical protein
VSVSPVDTQMLVQNKNEYLIAYELMFLMWLAISLYTIANPNTSVR